MEGEQLDEWHELERQARAWLAEPPRRHRHSVALHAAALPSFEDGSACTILVPGPRGQGTPLGVRRVWKRSLDAGKFESPVERLKPGVRVAPTLEEIEVDLASDAVDALVQRAAQVRVPARAAESFGVDGTGFVLQLGDHFTVARFEWWGEAPPGWEGLADLARAAFALVPDSSA